MVRLTDRPDMALDVYRGRKTTTQQQQSVKQPLLYYTLKKIGHYYHQVLWAVL